MRKLASVMRPPQSKPGRPSVLPKQLTMVWRVADVASLPDVHLPDGYRLGRFRTGRDEDAWVAALQANGELGDWDRPRLARDVTSALATPRGGVHIRWCSRVVATASACCDDVDARCRAYVGYVNVHPAHRGRRLGRAVITEVLRELVREGFTEVHLKTDDHRQAALRLYVALGFRPVFDPADAATARRWEAAQAAARRPAAVAS